MDTSNENKALGILKDIFENVNNWLQFAEAKNGALIGLNGLFLFKSVDYLFDVINGKLKVNITLVGAIIFVLLIAMLIALKSFFPNTSVLKCNNFKTENNNSTESRILIFYEGINKYQSSKQYLIDIYKQYFKSDVEINKLDKIELDYAEEIIINSRITSYKYKLFKWALMLNFIGIIMFFVLVIAA